MGWQRSDWTPSPWRPSWMDRPPAEPAPAPTTPVGGGGGLPFIGGGGRPTLPNQPVDLIGIHRNTPFGTGANIDPLPFLGQNTVSVGGMLQDYVSSILRPNSGFDLTQDHRPNYSLPNMFTSP